MGVLQITVKRWVNYKYLFGREKNLPQEFLKVIKI